jgi:WD40 repeat protein
VFRSDTGFSGGIAAMVALKDGHIAVSGKMSDTDVADLAIIDVNTGFRVMTLEGSIGTIWTIVQLNDGRLASAGRDAIVRIWDIQPLPVASKKNSQLDRCIRRLFGHKVFVSALVQLDNNKLLSGDGYGYIRMWDLREGFSEDVQPEDTHPVWEIHAHKTRIRSLHVLADGATFISCAVDNRTIRIWDAYTGQHVKMLVGMAAAGGVRQLVLLSDGVSLASISHSEAPIKIWGF